MKILRIAALLIFVQTVYAQEVSLEDMRSPSSPGFVLLGTEPTEIERPATPKQLSTSLQSVYTSEGFVPGFALEAAPYWLKNRPNITFRDYVEKSYKNIGENLRESFSISLAVAGTDYGIDSSLGPGVGLSYGFRLQILSGTGSLDDNQPLLDALKVLEQNYYPYSNFIGLLDGMVLARSVSNINELLAAIVTVKEGILSFDYPSATPISYTTAVPMTQGELRVAINTVAQKVTDFVLANRVVLDDAQEMIDGLNNEFILDVSNFDNEEYKEAIEQIQKLVKERDGLFWEISGAGANVIENNDIDSTTFTRFGVWSTFSYRFKLGTNQVHKKTGDWVPRYLDIMLVGRYLWNYSLVDTASYLDFGGRLIYNTNKFNISCEAVGRHLVSYDNNNNFTWRLSAMAEYKINDLIYLTYSVGKDFDDNAIEIANQSAGNFFTSLGLNFAIGNNKVPLFR